MRTQVVDKHGNVVERDGPLQDGDRVHVPYRMMDGAPNSGVPGLTAAQREFARRGLALADAARGFRNAFPKGLMDQWIADLRRPVDPPRSLVTDQARADGAYDAMSATIRDGWQGDRKITSPDMMAARDADSAYEAMRRHISAGYRTAV